MGITDVHRHLRTMEDAILAALEQEGVQGRSRHEEGIDYTGVWVEDRKIASIGVHVSRGVTTHGFAVNVTNDLEPFSWVVACGLPEVQMTSIAAEQRRSDPRHASHDSTTRPVGKNVGVQCFRREMAYRFCLAHGRRQRLVSARRLGIDTTNLPGLATEQAPKRGPSRREAIPA
jgi:lipoyl(octanoyl) transferase